MKAKGSVSAYIAAQPPPARATIRFSLDEPVPARLLARIAKFRVREEAERATLRATARKQRIRA
jgi:uncharacterized protein YdhG (YjbR/CyaY superfamily)